MFAATQDLIVCVLMHHLFTDSYLTMRIRSQARNDYDPSFVTEALREIQYSDTANQSINLLKDVAIHWSLYEFSVNGMVYIYYY